MTCARWPATCPAGGSTRGPYPAVSTRPATSRAGRRRTRSPRSAPGGICGVLVNAAGDIASSGGLGNGTPFRIGIADPFAPLRLAEIVELTGAIATSGTYERGEHLIDPRSGRPAARAASASVTGPDLGLADALATALAVAGEQGLALIDGLDGYEALVINHDGSKRRTQRFPVAAADTA